MTLQSLQTVSGPLAKRAAALGLTLLRVGSDGVAAVGSDVDWFEQKLINSAWFFRLVTQRRDMSSGENGFFELANGLYFAEFSANFEQAADEESLGLLLLGKELSETETLQRICDSLRLDRRATEAKLETTHWLSRSEAKRIAQAVAWMANDLDAVSTHRRELHQLSDELATNYEELSLLYKLSSGMSLDQPPSAFFENACQELQEVCGLGWVSLQITENQPRLNQLRGAAYTAGQIDLRKPLRQLGRELIEQHAGRQGFTIIDDTSKLPGVASQVSRSLLIVPLVCDGEILAVMFGGDRVNDEHIDSIDAKLCASLCNTLAIFLENLMLLEDSQSLFMGTLHALTSAIDAKDSYTFGHSERVALLSQMLARAAGIDQATVERIYIAGLVHDVGKIGVPEDVLSKPGKLTDDEFAAIKMHPGIGANILRGIRQMDDLIPGVLYHHERWDGKGYPEKRAGMDIPLFGRVIGLADAFDAMSSDRTYRSALSLETVLAEIEKCKGTQFDPELAEVFLKLDLSPYFQMIQRHQATQQGRDARSENRGVA
ncbi:MAG: HD domain-containing phosphohydrolase [Planctomycetota bacterium]